MNVDVETWTLRDWRMRSDLTTWREAAGYGSNARQLVLSNSIKGDLVAPGSAAREPPGRLQNLWL
ncbi:unnamed protein product [Diplocarpon coronariae]